MTPKEKQRNVYLLKTYGISSEQYSKILEDQKGSCAVCQRHHSEFKSRLAVDHDHHSGRVRGLLCIYCNRRLVGRHRDANLLRRIADYVEGGTDYYVPKKVKRKKKVKV